MFKLYKDDATVPLFKGMECYFQKPFIANFGFDYYYIFKKTKEGVMVMAYDLEQNAGCYFKDKPVEFSQYQADEVLISDEDALSDEDMINRLLHRVGFSNIGITIVWNSYIKYLKTKGIKMSEKAETCNMVHQAGDKLRTILRVNNHYVIGCFNGTYTEAKKLIKEEYKDNSTEQFNYLKKLHQLKNGSISPLKFMLHNGETKMMILKHSTIFQDELWDSPNQDIRESIAQCSTKYHLVYATDKSDAVRRAVAKNSDDIEVLRIIKDENDTDIEVIIAGKTREFDDEFLELDRYHLNICIALKTKDKDVLKRLSTHDDSDVRQAVMAATDDFDEVFLKDGSWSVRRELARKTDSFNHILKDDDDYDVRQAVIYN